MLIAIVDANRSFRAVLKSVLSGSDAEWVEFNGATEFIDWLATHTADMIITANELPDGSFADVVRVVRLATSDEYIPVYLFTSSASEALVREAFNLGVTDVFEKQHIREIVQLLRSLAFFSDIAKGAHVLLVEDDLAVSRYYASKLTQAGLQVSTVTRAREALALVAETPVDLVITDLNLADGELGQGIVRNLRRSQELVESQIPILVLTGSGESQFKTGLYYLGADDYLVKPVDPRQLIVRSVQLIEKFLVQKQLKAQMEDYRQRALYDSLTGAHNRYGLLENGLIYVDRCRREHLSLGVLYCDLDNFKQVNDTHGHDTGDRVITAACECIRSACRGRDLVVRWGGDEFVVILQLDDDGIEHARSVAAVILENFRDQAAELYGVGCSMGLSCGSPESIEALMELIDRADLALYHAKRAGKGRLSLAPAGKPAVSSDQTFSVATPKRS